jgi:hypothetical protein
MPNWKKVIVSGSAGNLSSLSVDTFVSASSINVKGTITADSGSFIYLTTVYETSSIIFSSGSNVLGDESSDLQTLWGRVNLPSGPLTVTGSINTSGGFTGSLLGTASQAISSSYALTSSYFSGLVESASYAATASFANSFPDQGFNFTQTVGTASWTVNHNLNSFTPLVDVYDSTYNQLIPASVSSVSANTTQITFSTAQAGYAIVSKGSGISSQTAISASFATTASYAASVGINFVQSSPSSTWTIVHNLNNKYPLVQIYDSSDATIIPASIVGTSTSTVTVTFSTAISGYARVI